MSRQLLLGNKTLFSNLLLLLFIHLGIAIHGQNMVDDGMRYVVTEGGLKLRTANTENSEVIRILPKGLELQLLSTDTLQEQTISSGEKGRWVFISSGNEQGFVFDLYLSKFPPFNFVKMDNEHCWSNDILLDLASAIGKVDSFEYSNYAIGEGTYNMKYFKLKNGANYIEHGRWEDWENEIQFNNLSEKEVYHYVKSILKYCPWNDTIFDQNYFKSNRTLSIYQYEVCCKSHIRIYSNGKTLLIRIQADPGS